MNNPEARRLYHREYMREYLRRPGPKKKHAARVAKNNAVYMAVNRAALAVFKKSGCVFCPETDVVCLDAHHRDPREKEFSIGESLNAVSRARFKKELAKCVCVCSNCHRKLHAGRRLKRRIITRRT